MTSITPLTQTQAAALRGVTARRLRQLDSEDNPPPKLMDGGYDPTQYGKWLKRIWSVPEGEYDYDAERARLTHHQANKTALEEQVLQGSLITAEEVESVWSSMIGAFRARMLSVPGRAAQGVIATADISEAEQIIRDLVYEALSELADYDPEQYRTNRGKGQSASSPAPESDSKPVGGLGAQTKQRSQRRARKVEH
jgi:phage terminase Nu1 subunit (DNA packaging protein)